MEFKSIKEIFQYLMNGYKYELKTVTTKRGDQKRLENLGFVYISLNYKIIQNIKKYQKEQGFSLSVDLKPRKKVIVLKKLIK